MTVDQVCRVDSEELLNRSFKYYYTVDTSAFSNDDFDIFVNSLEKSHRNSTKKFKPKRNQRRITRACKKLVDYPLTDSDVYENVSSGVSYMEIVDESYDVSVDKRRNINNFSGASSVLLDVSSSYECLSSIGSPQSNIETNDGCQLRQLQRANTSLECLLNRNKSLKDIFSYFDEDVKIDDSSTTSLHRIGRGRQGDKFLTYDDEKYDNQVYLYKKQQKSVDNMVNEFQRLKSSYLQQTLNDWNSTRSTNTVGRLDKNRIQFFENMCMSGDGVPNNTTEVANNKLNNTQKSLEKSHKIIEENEKNLSLSSVNSLLPLYKILPVGKLKIEEELVKKLDCDAIQTSPVIPVYNVNLKGSCDKEKSFNKEIFSLKQASLNSTPIKNTETPPPMILNHSSPITPPQPPINWETHPTRQRESIDHATQTTPKKFSDNETNTTPTYKASPVMVVPPTPTKSEISARNLSFTTFDIDEDTFQENYSCLTFDDAPFININDKSLLISLENFLAIWDLSLIDMIIALINENCNLTQQTEVIVRTNVKEIDTTSEDLQFCHMVSLAYESNELGAVMKLSLFDPNTNKDKDVKIVFCAIGHDQMDLLDEKLGIVTDNILIYVAFLLKVRFS